MPYESAYNNRGETLIINIDEDDGVADNVLPDEIDFSPYDNPDISVDSSSRFATHEIIGGTTVRQKIGEDQTDVQMSGVCTEEVAIQVDKLRKAKVVTVLSERVGGSMRCQVASTSTEPLQSGGAADMDGGDFLYSFNINLVEVVVTS